jgi:hypothetical protein
LQVGTTSPILAPYVEVHVLDPDGIFLFHYHGQQGCPSLETVVEFIHRGVYFQFVQSSKNLHVNPRPHSANQHSLRKQTEALCGGAFEKKRTFGALEYAWKNDADHHLRHIKRGYRLVFYGKTARVHY